MKKILFIMLLTLLVSTGCETKEITKEEKLKINTSENVISDKTIDNLEISNVTLTYENNQSTFKCDVKNINNIPTSVEEITIHIKTSIDEYILTGYIGGEMQPGEVVTLTTSYNKDITDAKNIEYEIVR